MITTLIPILAEFWFGVSPKRMDLRIVLSAIYGVYFIIPLLILMKMLVQKEKVE